MNDREYDKGVAFVFEGPTEDIFYETLLYHFSGRHPSYNLHTLDIVDSDIDALVSEGPDQAIVICRYTLGSITNISQAGPWFTNRCKKQFPGIPWTIFLCYDTDSYKNPITKFHEGDWARLRRKLQGNSIIDLAAQAEIEDLFMLDTEGICLFLGVPVQDIPNSGKGKRKLKNFFNTFRKSYHEGERAQNLISSLDMDTIVARAGIPLIRIEKECFP